MTIAEEQDAIELIERALALAEHIECDPGRWNTWVLDAIPFLRNYWRMNT